MIEKLELKNFQSHKHSILNFSKGLNVIVGTSDVGKSAIMRSVRWIIWNRPSGDDFRSWWGGTLQAQLTIDGKTITRHRGKTTNRYLLDGFKDPFEAFGTGVPDEIVHFLDINTLNLQQQLESHFLLTNTPGEVASHFNDIAHLDTIDLSRRNIDRWINELNQTIKTKENDVKELNKKLKQYDYIPELDGRVKGLEQQDERLNLAAHQYNTLTNLSNTIIELENEIDDLNLTIQLEPKVTKTLELQDHIAELHTQVQQLEELVSNIIDFQTDIENEEAIIHTESATDTTLELIEQRAKLKRDYKSLNQLVFDIKTDEKELESVSDVVRHEKQINGILKAIQAKETLESSAETLDNLITDIQDIQNDIPNKKKQVQILVKQYDKAMPEVCPLCGRASNCPHCGKEL